MLTDVFTRRAALFGFGAFAAVGLGGCNTTPPGFSQSPAVSGAAVHVDTSPLVAYVGNPTAGWVEQSLPGELARLSGRSAGGVHVRSTHSISATAGQADPDLITGVAMVGGRTIHVRANSTYWSSPTDQALPEQALQGRVQALSVAFAYRLRRKIGS